MFLSKMFNLNPLILLVQLPFYKKYKGYSNNVKQYKKEQAGKSRK